MTILLQIIEAQIVQQHRLLQSKAAQLTQKRALQDRSEHPRSSLLAQARDTRSDHVTGLSPVLGDSASSVGDGEIQDLQL